MPTAARLMAAGCFAILALVVSQMIIPLVPEGKRLGYFVPINMLVGFLIGWVMIGPRAGGGMGRGISNGLTGAFLLILWGIATQAVIEMIRLSMLRRYDGFAEAILAAIGIGAEFFMLMATVAIGVTVVVGGVISGLLTNYAEGRWR